jgi:hypothetical protein
MMVSDRNDKRIKITLDDLNALARPTDSVLPLQPIAASSGASRNYGNICAADVSISGLHESKGSVLLQGWFYLGAAGLVGAIVGWAICEPGFVDVQGGHSWGNTWMAPTILAILCIGFAVAESIAEHSAKKAAIRTLLALPLGIVFGFFFEFFGNLIYTAGLAIALQLGPQDTHNPIAWIARGIAWTVFGVAGGLVYGIVGQSAKKAKYGILGGMLGAGIGGLIFDPIDIGLNGAALSRMVGFALFGLATGVSMGIVESALKDRWLYVSAGPLAGKQFILYKQITKMGSGQHCDVYLFKDPSIQPEHALLETRGPKVQMRAQALVYINGQPIQSRVLQDGDVIQVGRYGFRYKEKSTNRRN